jgi:hypothetical protein
MFNIPEVDTIDFKYSFWEKFVLDCTGNYDLVVGDGFNPDNNEDNYSVILFWVQFYAAIRHILPSGSIIIKAVDSFNRLFGPRSRANMFDLGTIFGGADGFACRVNILARFTHFTVCKPLGSTYGNRERYYMFLGYKRVAEHIGFNTDNILGPIVLMENDIHTAEMNATKMLDVPPPMVKKVPDDIPLFMGKLDTAPRLNRPIYAHTDPSSQVVGYFKRHESQARVKQLANVYDYVVILLNAKYVNHRVPFVTPWDYELKVGAPAHVTGYEVYDVKRATFFESYVVWLVKAVSALNYKAFVLETLQRSSLVSRFKVEYVQSGPDNASTWRVYLAWQEKAPDRTKSFVAAVVDRTFRSSECKTRRWQTPPCGSRSSFNVVHPFMRCGGWQTKASCRRK